MTRSSSGLIRKFGLLSKSGMGVSPVSAWKSKTGETPVPTRRCVTSSSMHKSDRDRGDNAQRDEDEERYAHANRQAVGKWGATGRDSHEPREPFVEFHSMSSFRIRRTLWRDIKARRP